MEIIKLEAKVSQPGAARARPVACAATGKIPAVAYGKELPAVSLSVAPKGAHRDPEERATGRTRVVELDVEGGKKLTVLLRDYTVHPVTRELLHADFVADQARPAGRRRGAVPLQGQGGRRRPGGILRQVFRKLPIRCLPEQIPRIIEHDVTALDLGDHVKTSDLALPEGVTVRLPADQTVAGVVAPEKEKPEESRPTELPARRRGCRRAGAAAPAAGAAGAALPRPAAGAAAAPAKDDKKAAAARTRRSNQAGSSDSGGTMTLCSR